LAQEQALKLLEEQHRIATHTAEAQLLASAAAHTSSMQPPVNKPPVANKGTPSSITTGSNNTKVAQAAGQKNHTSMNDQVSNHSDNRNGNGEGDAADQEEAEHADFGLSGALQEDTETGNVKNGVVLKFAEPEDAAEPDQRWRLYVFKDKAMIKTLFLHRSSAYLVGRDPRVADILTEHSSCSKQHAVIQFRYKRKPAPPGSVDAPPAVVRPYIIDLESTNGVTLNGTVIDHSRYIELLDKDVIQFGESTREYVIMSPEVVTGKKKSS
jgi:smad nuclear-interacting protein 1